jgi:hypothetical protein
MFALETSARKMIHELVTPILNKMNEDKERMAMINLKQSSVESRIAKLEYLLNVSEKKP